MLPEIGIGLIVGLVAGWGIAWMRRGAEIARLNASREYLEKEVARLNGEQEKLRTENSRIGSELSAANIECASLNTALQTEQGNHAQKLATLTDQFKVLAGEILKENSKTFTEQNQTNIGNLLNQLEGKFGEFQKKVESLEKDGLTGRTELKTQIESLSKLNERLSQDANNLVTALKGSSQQQGQWGEQLLESILEEAGLRKGHQYFTQESFSREGPSANGRNRARLDVLVKLPGDRDLILDSKVSLNAYNDYCAAQDDAAREAALGRHLTSVRGHIRGLAAQEYHLLDGVNSPDFVFMFVPLEPAFMLAISGDSKLLQEAWDKNILLVGPSTVLYVLRIVAQIWRQEQQKKEVDEVYRRGAELYNKLADFAADLMEVGKNLDKARDSYDEAVKKLSTGRGNAIRRAEMLKDLGVKPSKAIPMALVDQAFDDVPLELAAGANGGED
jgi:DNA recombination protein RmuC